MHLNFYSLLQVFLDEVNTTSCLGLFKEVIVDRTLDGKVCLVALLTAVSTVSLAEQQNGYTILELRLL